MVINSYFVITVLLGGTLVIFKNIFLKLLLVVLWYPMLILALFSCGLSMPGIIGVYESRLQGEIANTGALLYIIGYIVFCLILFPLRKNNYVFPKLKVSGVTRSVLFVLTALGALPLLNTHSETGIKSATFYLVFSIILLTTHVKKDPIWFFHLCLSLALIALGERVDSLFIVVFLFFVKGKNFKADVTKNKKIYLGGLVFFVLLVTIGFRRGGEELSYSVLLYSFVSQRTVCDVVYIYLTSISYIADYGCRLDVLQSLFFGLFPGQGVTSPLYYTNVLSKYMDNPGGGLFFTEGVLALGHWGVPLYFGGVGLILRKVLTTKAKFGLFMFLMICVMSCRLAWYGLVYIYKPLLLFYLIYKIFNLRRCILKNPLVKTRLKHA